MENLNSNIILKNLLANVIRYCERNQLSKKKFVLYGCGNIANFLCSKYTNNIQTVVDKNSHEINSFNGFNVENVNVLKELTFDYILISVLGQEDLIEKDLIETYNIKKEKILKLKATRFKESAFANKYLKNLKGIEIGGSVTNAFRLNTLNVDYTEEITVFKAKEMELNGYYLPVDIVSDGDDLPLKNNTWDFVINAHVIEHFWDPIKAIKEWFRIIKPNGYILMIVPHKDRTFDSHREITYADELIKRHLGIIPAPEVDDHRHWSVWDTESFLELCNKLKWKIVDYQDIDDKIGNGFTVLLQK